MKYLITFLIGSFLLLGFSFTTEAQILNRLKDKVQDKVEEKVEQKIDSELEKAANKMVESSWNSIFGEMPEGDDNSGNSVPFSPNSNVTTEDTYNFDIVTTMEIETVRENGETDPPTTIKMHFKEGGEYTGTKFQGGDMGEEHENLFLIYDFNNEAMVMLMESEEGKVSFAYDWKQALNNMEQMEEEQEEIDWEETEEWNGYQKIGQKTIAGYLCDGYRTEENNSRMEIWVTRDAVHGMERMFGANANAKQMKGFMPENYPYGMMMEMVAEDLESGETTTMKVTDISENANVSYNMDDYPRMGMEQPEE